LTARAYHRVLKLSRTMADLAGAEEITQVHLAEALQYRPKVDVIQYNHSLEMKTWSCGL
jgi:magnesium chelatase family protein